MSVACIVNAQLIPDVIIIATPSLTSSIELTLRYRVGIAQKIVPDSITLLLFQAKSSSSLLAIPIIFCLCLSCSTWPSLPYVIVIYVCVFGSPLFTLLLTVLSVLFTFVVQHIHT